MKKHHESQKKTNCTKGHFRKSCWHSGIRFCILASSTLLTSYSCHWPLYLNNVPLSMSSFCLPPQLCYPHTYLTRMSYKPSPEILNSSRIVSSLIFCNVPPYKTFFRFVPCFIEASYFNSFIYTKDSRANL